ncbi:MAG: hypothetical protein HOH77_11465 [Candidatus Latescibacteria bacterium]|nr:hypothetical protein [Candidatus Latescibacterota bacterium]
MDFLSQDSQTDLDETLVEVSETVREAAKASLRDIKLMEEGHCPSCGHKTLRQFVFTTVCSNCGWFSFISPEEGKSIIHLKSGRQIECGTTFDTKGKFLLGITNGVVRAKVSTENVEFVEFAWTDEEIKKKRESRIKEQAGIDSWTEKPLNEYDDEDEPVIVYASFGPSQERFVFGNEDNAEAFKKQYAVRIHKNCYERPCVDCDLCTKKYNGEDETIYKQMIEDGVV